MKTPILLASLALLAGCATGLSARDGEQLARYRAHAGAPVDSFRYLGRMDSWTSLGSETLAIWTSPSQAWLLELHGPCPDLDFARAIGISESAGRVHARFDRVTPIGTGTAGHSCAIREIRPLDVKAIRAARRGSEQP
jgi:hypothetical protein